MNSYAIYLLHCSKTYYLKLRNFKEVIAIKHILLLNSYLKSLNFIYLLTILEWDKLLILKL